MRHECPRGRVRKHRLLWGPRYHQRSASSLERGFALRWDHSRWRGMSKYKRNAGCSQLLEEHPEPVEMRRPEQSSKRNLNKVRVANQPV
jgi:hypothetical protein